MNIQDVATVIRSKNAGIYYITIDVMFDDEYSYKKVRDSEVINEDSVSDAYGIDPKEVRIFEYDPGYALKITIPRSVSAGSAADSDVYGAQQHALINEIELPFREL